MPVELRPPQSLYVPACVTTRDGYMLNTCAYCFVSNADGKVAFQVADAIAGAVNRGCCFWPIGAYSS